MGKYKIGIRSIFVVTLFTLISPFVLAEEIILKKSGTWVCGGSHVAPNNFSLYVLRNFDNTNPIEIERLTFYDSTGAIIFNYPASDALPAGMPSVIPPRNSYPLDTNTLPSLVANTNLPIQADWQWSSTTGKKAHPIHVNLIRITPFGQHPGRCEEQVKG